MLKENESKVETIIKTKAEPDQPAKFRLNGLQRLRESALIVAVLAAIFCSISLLTYSPADPSWSQTAWGAQLNNAGGYIGAWVADTLFFVFGSLAYTIPVIIIFATWLIFIRHTDEQSLDFTLWATRLLGIAILLLTSCGLADINFDDLWYFSSGGVVGDVLSSLALPTFNVLGATLTFLFFWGAGFTLLTGISWLTIVEFLGDMAIQGLQAMVNRLRGGNNEELIVADTSQSLAIADDVVPVSEPVADEISPPSVVEDQTDSDLVPDVEPTPRRFNIHIPQSQQPQPERSKRLAATIEELDDEALQQDDFASPQEMVSAASATSAVAVEEHLTEDEPFGVVDIDIEDDKPQPMISDFSVADDEPESMADMPATEPPNAEEFQAEELEGDVQDEDAQDEDVEAFQQIVAAAQAKQQATLNPFLAQPEVNLPKPAEPMPTLELLYQPEKRANFIDQAALEQIARLVESKLADYKITAEVVGIFPRPGHYPF